MATTAVVTSRDLLRIIFSFSACHRTNALVSRAWCNEALDRIWYRITDFRVLVRLLIPPNLRKCYSSVLDCAPTPSGWETFYKYSTRVRVLQDMRSRWDEDLSPSFAIMAATRPRDYLFPNLRRLEFQPSSADPLSHLSMFLSPILNDLKICIPSMNAWDALMRSLAAIPLHSPQLGRVHLEVDIWGIDRQMYSLDHSNCIGIQCLSAITSLKRLALPFPEAPSLVAIATSFPSLTQLSLTGVGVHSSTTVYELPPSSFPAVQVLELDSLPLSLALAILQLDLFQLHSIHIEVGKFGDFDPIFSSIAANHSDVESLRIEAGYLEYSTTRPSLGFSELSHLLSSCRHLRKLAIDLSHQVDLKMSWDDLLEIVQTLPLLQELELSNSLKASDDPPCLCNLAELAPHCPTLTRLSMNVDARICDIPEIMTPTRFRSLQCWDVRCSPIIRPAEDVALLLSSIFPAECTVEYVANTFLPAEDVNCWKSVGELLPLLGQARRHERSRIDIASMDCS